MGLTLELRIRDFMLNRFLILATNLVLNNM